MFRNTRICLNSKVEPVLPDTILEEIFSYTVERQQQKLLNIKFRNKAFESCSCLTINPSVPLEILKKIIFTRIKANVLILDHVKVVDDVVIKLVLCSMRGLKVLSISYCTQVTFSALENIRPDVAVKARGCWRIATPSPYLSAYEVTELQLLALQENDAGSSFGIQSAGRFSKLAAHCYNALTVNEMSEGLRSIVNCISFNIRVLGVQTGATSLRRSFAHVRVQTKDQSIQHFLWDLVKQDGGPFPGCWLVYSVRSICAVHRSA